MVSTAQAVLREYQLTFGCTRLQELEYYCMLQSTQQFSSLSGCSRLTGLQQIWQQSSTFWLFEKGSVYAAFSPVLWNQGNAHFSILTGCNWILYCVCEVALVLRLGFLICCQSNTSCI